MVSPHVDDDEIQPVRWEDATGRVRWQPAIGDHVLVRSRSTGWTRRWARNPDRWNDVEELCRWRWWAMHIARTRLRDERRLEARRFWKVDS